MALVAGVLVAAATGSAWAHGEPPPAPGEDADEAVLPALPTYQANEVNVTEQLRAVVPRDATFRTVDGTPVTLGAAVDGGGDPLPTILTFNYASCPMLCSLQLNGLMQALPKLDLRLGQQYRIITIILDPDESLARASAMRDRYLEHVPENAKSTAKAGWTFLVAALPGDASQIRRVADAVGFTYKYIPERAEYAHAAALIFLSSRGTVTRYVYGIEFAPDIMNESLAKAGIAEPSTAVGFMNRCYHFDPDANNHSRAGVLALRLGAVGFLVCFLGGFGFFYLRRVSSRREGPIP